jgi:type III pantothenate kinase
MLVTVAVQNARTALGVYADGELRACWRLATEPQRTADEWSHLIAALVAEVCPPRDVTGLAICSAVPSVLHELRSVGPAAFPGAEVVIVGPGVKSGLPVLTDNPREVGTDRIANVVGALDAFAAPLIVVDFGTATTFDVVDYSGAYKGGIIAPGINLSLDALVAAAAKLPRIAIEAPEDTSVVGRTTESQMLTGIYWGYVAMIEGLVARLKAEVGRPVSVVATGGLAPLFERHGKLFDAVEPDLTIQGLGLLYNQVAAS